MNPLASLVRELHARRVRFVVIGVSGANYYAPSGQASFITRDHDLFLPPDSDNLVQAWAACSDAGLEMWLGDEPLDVPRDRWLADRIVERRAVTRVSGPDDFLVDLTLVMKSYDFEAVWNERRDFVIEGVNVPVARLLHIVTSKHATGRDKDRLFLATHRDALEQLLKKPDES